MQGVGFRWFVREAARRLDLAGWVANRPDGSVELSAAGTDDALAHLEAQVRQGPPGAMVQELVTVDAPAEAELPKPFVIQRGR